MKTPKQLENVKHLRFRTGLAATVIATVSVGMMLVLPGTAEATVATVPLGTANSFAVLAGSGITNTGATTVNGNIGSYPTPTITGTSTMTINGTNHGGDSVTQGAKTDLTTAYNTAASEGPTSPITGDLGGQTLTPGVYNSSSSIGLTGTLTLNGQNNTDPVFVFQAGSTLTTASASQIILENGAQACNVFWQVGSSATLGTTSSFDGTILALTSVTAKTGATVSGRLLASNGAVTLDTNTITVPTCTATASTTTTTASTTTTTTAATTTTTTTSPTGGIGGTGGGGTTGPNGVIVPTAHTGEPWAGWPWWAGTAALGIGGVLLMAPWNASRRLRRRQG